MAKLKMLKFPKKPKRSASLEQKQKYLIKRKEIEQENKRRESLNKESDRLSTVISGLPGSYKVLPSGFSVKHIRKSKVGKRKAAKTAKAKTTRKRTRKRKK
jgi:hypothetical protein